MEFMTQVPEDGNTESFRMFGSAKETSMAFFHLKSFHYYTNLGVNKFIWLWKIKVVRVHTMKAHA